LAQRFEARLRSAAVGPSSRGPGRATWTGPRPARSIRTSPRSRSWR
jgi:hypothetical protein